MVSEPAVPSLFDWAGGQDAIERLFVRFHERVPAEPVLRDVFARMDSAHAQHVAAFVSEVFGGPSAYSRDRGGHPHMVHKHLGRGLTELQRRRWIELLLDCADEVGLPQDPEFRSAFVAYLEWGSRLAVINSQPGAAADSSAPMPRWGWGVPKGPYQP
jgi:hemoglobin